MGFHVDFEIINPTMGCCFMAGNPRPTSFVPPVIEASVVSGDHWHQAPSMQQGISQSMTQNFTGSLMFSKHLKANEKLKKKMNLKCAKNKKGNKNYGRHVQNRTR